MCCVSFLQGFQPDLAKISLVINRLDRSLKLLVGQVQLLSYILSGEQVTMARIRLAGCADWSAPLLFTCDRVRFFHDRGPNFLCEIYGRALKT